MAVYRPLPFVHHLLTKHLKSASYVIDATLGNGNDARFISTILQRNGKLWGFDIQKQAILQARAKIGSTACLTNIIWDGHHHMFTHLEKYQGKIDCVIFNLGYLPHGDEAITTTLPTTYSAILQAVCLLRQKGIIIIVTYPGHPNGIHEHTILANLFTNVASHNFFISTYAQINNDKNPPHVFIIEKR
ncbi:rRNA methyltransferase [Erysipelotrichaceae bacterium]|nr:rRNA methyltransferase [Erysipelotrichaceae bacterium]